MLDDVIVIRNVRLRHLILEIVISIGSGQSSIIISPAHVDNLPRNPLKYQPQGRLMREEGMREHVIDEIRLL